VSTFGVMTGAVGGGELVVCWLSGGWVRSPSMLRSIRHRWSTVVALSVNVSDLRMRLEDRRKGKYRRDDRKQAIRRTIVCLALICGPGLGIVCE